MQSPKGAAPWQRAQSGSPFFSCWWSRASAACSSTAGSAARMRCPRWRRYRRTTTTGSRLFRRRSDRLALLHDVGRKHFRRTAADVFSVVHDTGGDEERVARFQRAGWLTLDLQLERALDDVAELLSRMRVPAGHAARYELGEGLHHVPVWRTDVVILQELAGEAGLLRVENRCKAADRGRNQQALHGTSPSRLKRPRPASSSSGRPSNPDPLRSSCRHARGSPGRSSCDRRSRARTASLLRRSCRPPAGPAAWSSLAPDDPERERESARQDRDEVAHHRHAALFRDVELGLLVVFLGALVHLLGERHVLEDEEEDADAETDQGALDYGVHGGDFALGKAELPRARRARPPRPGPQWLRDRRGPPAGCPPPRRAAAPPW